MCEAVCNFVRQLLVDLVTHTWLYSSSPKKQIAYFRFPSAKKPTKLQVSQQLLSKVYQLLRGKGGESDQKCRNGSLLNPHATDLNTLVLSKWWVGGSDKIYT